MVAKRLALPVLVLALVGCERIFQRTVRVLDPYPKSYMETLEVAKRVLARHFTITGVDKAHGIVEASSLVRANMFTKYRTRAVARVFEIARGTYGVQVRVTNELEVSEPSLLGRGQPGYDWRAVGFDHVMEATLMAELEAERAGKVAEAAPRRPKAPARHRDVIKPKAPPKPARPATSSERRKSRNEELFEQYAALGELHFRRGEFDKALLEYQRATVACPHKAFGHLALAGVWAALGRYDAAAAALRQGAVAAKGKRLSAEELARLRRPATAIRQRLLLLKGWCKQRPEDRDARLVLAYYCLLANESEEAQTRLDELIRQSPDDVAARFLATQVAAARS